MRDYVGRHFESCWEFVRTYYEDNGVELPQGAFFTEGFYEVEHPRPGDIVIIDTGAHCGVVVSDLRVAHHVDNFGVVINRGDQFYQTRYYRHRG